MLASVDQSRPTLSQGRRLAAAAVCAVALTVGGWAAAQQEAPDSSAPHSGRGPIWHGRQHQPSREATQERLRGAGAGRDPSESQDELRTLNDLSRRLLPPGSPLPAPGVAKEAGSGR